MSLQVHGKAWQSITWQGTAKAWQSMARNCKGMSRKGYGKALRRHVTARVWQGKKWQGMDKASHGKTMHVKGKARQEQGMENNSIEFSPTIQTNRK